MPTPFHLAIAVQDVNRSAQFYVDLLGCTRGRSSATWIDFNLFGHQLVVHQSSQAGEKPITNPVDGQAVPVPHFGVVLPWAEWHSLAERLTAAKTPFVIEPTIRFQGEVGEQATMFFRDPDGHALEFKAFQDPDQLFAH